MSSESTSARALASRRNGARSRGPRTAAGKARSSKNALKHGLCARQLVVLPQEDAAAFEALEAALLAEPGAAGRVAGRAGAARGERRLAFRPRRSLGRRNGVGALFPNPAAKKPRCSSSAAIGTASSGSV